MKIKDWLLKYKLLVGGVLVIVLLIYLVSHTPSEDNSQYKRIETKIESEVDMSKDKSESTTSKIITKNTGKDSINLSDIKGNITIDQSIHNPNQPRIKDENAYIINIKGKIGNFSFFT